MQLTSSAFEADGAIPTRFTCDGDDTSPQLRWADLPPDTGSLALRCLDPDAPSGTFTHWLVWDLDPTAGGVDEGKLPSDAREGTNSFGKPGYGGPCPPPGHGVHHYHFELVALRQPLDLDAGASTAAFAAALRDYRIDSTQIVGTYERA